MGKHLPFCRLSIDLRWLHYSLLVGNPQATMMNTDQTSGPLLKIQSPEQFKMALLSSETPKESVSALVSHSLDCGLCLNFSPLWPSGHFHDLRAPPIFSPIQLLGNDFFCWSRWLRTWFPSFKTFNMSPNLVSSVTNKHNLNEFLQQQTKIATALN